MSLQVWLPLNGNLDNQGLAQNITFSMLTSSYTSFNNAGKIGKCLNNTSLNGGGLVSNTTINLTSTQSMFCWFKFTTLESHSNLGCGLVSQHRYPTNQGMGITIRYISSTTGYLSVNTGTGSSRTFNEYCGTTLLQANTWYHGGYTYDGTTIKIYVNGICEKTQTLTGMSVPADYLMIGCWSLGSSSGNSVHTGYKLNGYINDVRIYNHALTSEEVKKLSQGLVLHYPLNDGYIEQTKNLLPAASVCANWTTISIGENVGTLPLYNNTIGNKIVTYSAYIKNTSSVSVAMRLSPNKIDGGYAIHYGNFINSGQEGWSSVTVNMSDSSIYNGTARCYIQNGSAGSTPSSPNIKVRFAQVEEGTHRTQWTPSQRGGQYDKTIYQEPDGSLWVRMFHHNNPAGGLFASSDTFTTGVYKDANRWFDIYGIVDQLSRYEFMVKQKTTSNATEQKYRWIQTTSPLTAVWDDIKPGKVTNITTSGYTNGGYGGLYKLNDRTYMVIANSSNGNWYGATGCWTAYNGGMPGYPNTDVTSGYMDLYARIDNNSLNNIDFSKVYDISGLQNHGSIIGGLLNLTSNTRRYNKAIQLQNNAYINMGKNIKIKDEITVALWGHLSSWASGHTMISCTQAGGWSFGASGGTNIAAFYVGTGASSNTYLSRTGITIPSSTDNWHHFAMTYDGFRLKTYIDGTLVGTQEAYSTKTPMYYVDNPVLLGCEATAGNTPGGSYFNGDLSDVRIYATALSADDVAALYRMGV